MEIMKNNKYKVPSTVPSTKHEFPKSVSFFLLPFLLREKLTPLRSSKLNSTFIYLGLLMGKHHTEVCGGYQ